MPSRRFRLPLVRSAAFIALVLLLSGAARAAGPAPGSQPAPAAKK
jgi:hypothetical protein